ncbi:MAG: hypothetical protein LBS93_00565, partial [Synergistaceae bacterium]|nr:hypothetical protein [Synergistaceae bacterium]
MGGDVVVSNLAFLVGTLGALPGSRLLSDPGGLVACDSGIGEAYENYALLIPRTLDFNGPEKLDSTDEIEKLVASGREFFARETSPHIWPLFPSSFASPEALRRARLLLESVGAREEGTFFGMEADVDSTKIPLHDDNAYSGRWLAKSGSLVSLDTEFSSDLSDWADAVWLGFDSGEPAPADFTRFVREAAFADGISLFALRSL